MKYITQEHINVLKNVYFNSRTENGIELYKTWMKHKYSHSIEVAEAGLKIMEREDAFKNLSENIKHDFALALLFHDYARAKEIDPQSAKNVGIDHATLGAMDMFELGYSSDYITFPILIHSRFDEDFLKVSDEVLSAREDFSRLQDNEKEFTIKMRQKFFDLTEDEKKIIFLGIDLVKDADKIANLMHIERMVDSKKDGDSIRVTKEAEDDIKNGRMVNTKYMNTLADQCLVWLSWIADYRFESTMRQTFELDIIERIKKHIRKRNERMSYNPQDLEHFEELLDLYDSMYNKPIL